jgi:hypothetical protein
MKIKKRRRVKINRLGELISLNKGKIAEAEQLHNEDINDIHNKEKYQERQIRAMKTIIINSQKEIKRLEERLKLTQNYNK